MYLIALATDYDGTLAHHGLVDDASIDALERLKASGRKLLLVTGRELGDLKAVFPRIDLFDVVVAENGALLYLPASAEERPLAPEPPPELVAALKARNVEPLSVGRGIVATWEPNEQTAIDVIRELGIEWQIIFNKGAVMILPSGVNKASGLAAALEELELSALNVIAFGDAENDHAFLNACGCSVAVANALDSVKADADIVTEADHGAGVVEIIDRLLADDLKALVPAARHHLLVGTDEAGEPALLRTDIGGVLIAGSSGIGKSTLATALLERLDAHGFQFCVMDPEGDYASLENAVVFGDAKRVPSAHEAIDLLRKPGTNLVVNMLGLEIEERPAFFSGLLPQIATLRARTGRPHWTLIDEAHHMLPASSEIADITLPKTLPATILVTVHPDKISSKALSGVTVVLGVGEQAGDVIASLCNAIGIETPPLPETMPGENEVLFWDRNTETPPRPIKVERPRQERTRHTRKYAEGTLGEDKSFYFRGPERALNLRAQNLMLFLQLADGIDDATWLYHLRQGDYSGWFRSAIKDNNLADEAEELERQENPDATRSREQIREIVTRRYTAPAET